MFHFLDILLLFIHSSAEGYLGGYHHLTVMNIHVQVSMWIEVFGSL